MMLVGAQPDLFVGLVDSTGTASFLSNLGRCVVGLLGVDAYSIQELDERRKTIATLAQGCIDGSHAGLLGAATQNCSPREILQRSKGNDLWLTASASGAEAATNFGTSSRPTSMHALLGREGMTTVVLSVARTQVDTTIDHQHRKRLAQVLPMLRSLWRAHSRSTSLEAERNAIFEGLSHQGVGAVTLDSAARAMSVNRCAAELMTDTEALKLSHAGLYSNDPAQTHALQTALEGIFAELRLGARAKSRALTFTNAKTRRSLKAHLHPIPVGMPRSGMRSPVVVALLSDPQADVKPHVRDTAKVFGLTGVETELVCLLVEGKSVDEAAAAMRVSSHTARKYLQQVFTKTGTSRQADVLLLLVSGAAPGRLPTGPPRRHPLVMSRMFSTEGRGRRDVHSLVISEPDSRDLVKGGKTALPSRPASVSGPDDSQ